jgi:hypothetical protein
MVDQSPRRFSEAEWSATDVGCLELGINCPPRWRSAQRHFIPCSPSSHSPRDQPRDLWLALAGDGKAVVRGQDHDLDPVVGGYKVVEIPKRGEVRIGWISINDPPTPKHVVRK